MSDDLVKRLRSWAKWHDCDDSRISQAADAIERLTAERDESFKRLTLAVSLISLTAKKLGEGYDTQTAINAFNAWLNMYGNLNEVFSLPLEPAKVKP
jgi:hypothetical protein